MKIGYLFVFGLCLSAMGSIAWGQQCPASVKGSKIPSKNWSASSNKAGYYAPDSAIINVGNGQVAVSQASYSTVKSDMGTGFASANFSLAAPGSSSNLGAGVVQCSYDGPRFKKGGKDLQATVTVNCSGASCSF